MNQILPTSSSRLSKPKIFFGKKIIFLIVLLILLISLIGTWILIQLSKKSTPSKPTQSISALPPIQSSQDAEERLILIASKLTDPSAAKTYQEALNDAATYTNPDRPPAIVENDRAGRYFGIYNQIVGQYYATRDSEILALAKQLRDFIKSNYPTKYESVNRTNGWEIKE